MAFERPPIDSDDVSDDDEGIEGLQPSKVSPSRYLSPVLRQRHLATAVVTTLRGPIEVQCQLVALQTNLCALSTELALNGHELARM